MTAGPVFGAVLVKMSPLKDSLLVFSGRKIILVFHKEPEGEEGPTLGYSFIRPEDVPRILEEWALDAGG